MYSSSIEYYLYIEYTGFIPFWAVAIGHCDTCFELHRGRVWTISDRTGPGTTIRSWRGVSEYMYPLGEFVLGFS